MVSIWWFLMVLVCHIPWWSVMLINFSCVKWLFAYFLLWHDCSKHLPIFNCFVYIFIYTIYDYKQIWYFLPIYGTPLHFLNHILPKVLNTMKASFMVCVFVILPKTCFSIPLGSQWYNPFVFSLKVYSLSF